MSISIGVIHAINISKGGVPKRSILSAQVTNRGLSGDRQRNLLFHGGPERAVCVYSLELIEQLRAEGHPIEPGTIGENLTLSGIDWDIMSAGATISIGSLCLTITGPASPCRNIASSFAGGQFVRVSEKLRRGWSRWYCRVSQDGVVTVGDRVVVSQTGESSR